mgnify:CR=1 FL=1
MFEELSEHLDKNNKTEEVSDHLDFNNKNEDATEAQPVSDIDMKT